MSKQKTLADVLDLEKYIFDQEGGSAFIVDDYGTKWVAGLDQNDAAFAVRLPEEDLLGQREKRRDFVVHADRISFPVTAIK